MVEALHYYKNLRHAKTNVIAMQIDLLCGDGWHQPG